MPVGRTISLTALAMLAFAGNSLLCRQALKHTNIDVASFTSIRLISGAIALWILVHVLGKAKKVGGSWPSAFALFAYAAGFSLAYVDLTAGTGALLLFGSVQLSMISYGLWRGEKLSGLQLGGLGLAVIGLVVLVLPGLAAPPILNSALMIGAGVAWGVYSLRGRGAGEPTLATAGNFIRTVPMAFAFSLAMIGHLNLDKVGIALALASGIITSGLGYAIWYQVLPSLRATQAATVQLSVPVIAALAGIALLGEQPSWRLALASIAIICGIGLVIYERSKVKTV